MGLQKIKFTLGADELFFNSMPSAIRGHDPTVNVAMTVTEGDELNTSLIGASDTVISVVFDKNNPLSFQDYDGGFNWITLTQDTGQSLVNWYMNICQGALNSFTLTRGEDTATVNMVNFPSLGFRPIPGDDGKYVGELRLRIQQ